MTMSKTIATIFVFMLLTNSASTQPSQAQCQKVKLEADQMTQRVVATMKHGTPQEKATLKSELETMLTIANQCLKIETDKFLQDLKQRGFLIEWQE
jgi:hypothetical protein